ncbi:flagellin, partial [Anoxybacillus flavithermus]|nr:flagellin [Anoxybacillus flavithermus]
ANVVDAGTGIQAGDITIGNASVAKYGSYQLKVEDDVENAGMKKLTLIDATTGKEVASQNNVDYGTDTVTLQGIQIDTSNGTGNGTISFTVEGDHDFSLSDGTTTYSLSVKDYNKSYIEIAGLKIDFNADITDGNAQITIVNNSLSMHIGANQDQTMNVAINDMSAKALGVDNLDVTTPNNAESAITTIDNAIKKVSAERSKLGAYQNRLEHTINNLGTASENLTAAESRIRDVDYALAA